MAADLITRIILDDKQFNNTLKKVKSGLDVTGSVASGLSSGLKGIAGQIAAAAGAYEVFDTAINSNAITQRLWNDSLGTAKESVDSFFTALTTGDWTVFEDGIINAIKLSKNYVQALREIKTGLQLTDVKLSVGEKEMNRYENIASNTNLSSSERESAFAKFQEVYKEHSTYISEASEGAYNRLTEMLKDKGIEGIRNADSLRELILDFQNPLTKRYSVLQRYMDLVSGKSEALSKEKIIDLQKHRFGDTATSGDERVKAYKKRIDTEYDEINKLLKLYPELEKARKVSINFGTEEKMSELLDMLDRLVGYQDRMETMTTQYRGLDKDFKNGKLIENGGGSKNSYISPDGSIGAIEQMLNATKAKLKLAVDPESRAELYAEISDLENQKHVIEFQYKHPNDPGKVEERGIPNLTALAKMPSNKIESPIKKKDVKNNTDFASSLMSISNIMGSITNLTNDGAAAWVAWGANLLSSVAAAIPAITTLIGLKSTEAVTNGVASATQTPIVGWLLAGAAAAAVIGALMSIPKFATGGIVPGTSTFGDNMLARVNSGEMILNTSQQSNLFSLLNGGGSVSHQKLELKVKGKDLVAVLGNYNNQRNKIL